MKELFLDIDGVLNSAFHLINNNVNKSEGVAYEYIESERSVYNDGYTGREELIKRDILSKALSSKRKNKEIQTQEQIS